MKKSYIHPSIEAIETQPESFVCTSPNESFNIDGDQEADQLSHKIQSHPIWGNRE